MSLCGAGKTFVGYSCHTFYNQRINKYLLKKNENGSESPLHYMNKYMPPPDNLLKTCKQLSIFKQKCCLFAFIQEISQVYTKDEK